MNEFIKNFGDHANVVDYCENFTSVKEHDGVLLDTTRLDQTGESVVFSAQGEGILIYETKGLLGFCITLYAESVSSDYVTTLISKDGENFETCEWESHLNTYAITQTSQGLMRFNLTNRNTFPFGYRYLKLCLKEPIAVGKVELFAYNNICDRAPFNMELDHTLNVRTSERGYSFVGRFPETISFYHDDMMAVAFEVRYRGNRPDIKLSSSLDGEIYDFCEMAATEPIMADDEWYSYTIYHTNCLKPNTKHMKMHLNKSDNLGDNLYIAKMYTAVGTFVDSCADVGDLLFWSPELKQIHDKGFFGFGLYQKGTFFTVNKNDITGFCFDVRMQQGASIELSVSSDGESFIPIKHQFCDVVEHNNNFLNPNPAHIYCSVRNAEPIPTDMDYVRFELIENGPYITI